MCALWLSTTCRVCLASDRKMYRLANTALEETYERVTGGTLVVDGRPCCVCGVCLSALRRSRRFIDTARGANDALDRWSRNQPDRMKLMECPLFSFTLSPMKIFEITNQGVQEITIQCIQKPVVKQELDLAENCDEGNVPNEEIEIKFEVPSDNVQDNPQILDNTECHNTQVYSGSGCINIYNEMIDIKMDPHSFVDVKLEDNVGEGVSRESDGRNQASPVEDCLLKRPGNLLSLLRKSRKRVKAIEEPESDPITSEHLYKDTKPAAAVQTKEKKFSCHLCNYKTIYKYVLKDHLMTHTGEKPYSCDMCDYKCIRKRSLKYHLLIHIEGQKFSCNMCDVEFTQKNSLLQHLLIHTGKKLFCCDMCDYKTIQKTSLRYHMLTHTREKPFSCDMCGVKFSRKDTLKRHLATHAGEKPFLCGICDFECSSKGSLNQHLLAHAGEKSFSCDMCGFKFLRKDTLRAHLLTHAGEKPFSCDMCGSKFRRKYTLRRHLSTHAFFMSLV